MAGAGGHFEYISDDGTTYCVRGDASNAAATGGVSCTPGPTTVYPRGWFKRYILATFGTFKRRVVMYDPTHGLWTGVNNTLTLRNFSDGTTGTADVTARVGEKRTSRG